ncbi:MAG: hypothetical protein NT027_19495 [Proteobacteria bacterium]|nr:hypothetical protein [Pseudomonadota bacterium]
MIRNWSIFALVICQTLSMVSCDKFKKPKKNDAEAAEEPSKTGKDALYGLWSGNYKPIDENGKVDGVTHTAQIDFYSKDDIDHFKISLLGDDSAFAEGQFDDFQSRKVFMQVTKSTMNRIPVSEGILEGDYELNGKSIHLKFPAFELLMTRKTSTGSSNSSPETIEGNWTCKKNALVTRLEINRDLSWRASISQIDRKTIYLSGYGSKQDTNQFELHSDESSEDVTDGSKFNMTIEGKLGTLKLNASGQQTDLGTCQK